MIRRDMCADQSTFLQSQDELKKQLHEDVDTALRFEHVATLRELREIAKTQTLEFGTRLLLSSALLSAIAAGEKTMATDLAMITVYHCDLLLKSMPYKKAGLKQEPSEWEVTSRYCQNIKQALLNPEAFEKRVREEYQYLQRMKRQQSKPQTFHAEGEFDDKTKSLPCDARAVNAHLYFLFGLFGIKVPQSVSEELCNKTIRRFREVADPIMNMEDCMKHLENSPPVPSHPGSGTIAF